MSKLKETLYEVFGGFADKRIKKLDRSSTFIIDDRNDGDRGADGNLYSYFCQIFAEVIDDDTIEVELRGNVPCTAAVQRRTERHGGSISVSNAKITIKKGDQSNLNEIARIVKAVVAPGNRYPVKSYKYVCPRVADSLRTLSKTLDQAWDDKPKAENV